MSPRLRHRPRCIARCCRYHCTGLTAFVFAKLLGSLEQSRLNSCRPPTGDEARLSMSDCSRLKAPSTTLSSVLLLSQRFGTAGCAWAGPTSNWHSSRLRWTKPEPRPRGTQTYLPARFSIVGGNSGLSSAKSETSGERPTSNTRQAYDRALFPVNST